MQLTTTNSPPPNETLVAKLCTRTTCHGPLDAYQSRGWGRAFWALCTLGAFAAVAYFSYQATVQYLNSPSATSITDVTADELLFPNVTICHSMRYNSTPIKERLRSPFVEPWITPHLDSLQMEMADFEREFIRYLRVLSFSMEFYDKNDTMTRELIRVMEGVYQGMFNQSVTPETQWNIVQFLDEISFDCRKLFVSCQFNRESFDCCDRMRKSFTDNGYCFAIDPRPPGQSAAYQRSKGEDFGLRVTVQLDESDYDLISFMEMVGLRVHVADYATSMDSNPIGVPLDMYADIKLRPIYYLLDPSIDKCSADGKPLDGYEAYSKKNCEMKCFEDAIREGPQGCEIMAGVVARQADRLCSPYGLLSGVYPRLIGAANDSALYMQRVLECFSSECPRLCDYWSYTTSVMYSELNRDPISIDRGTKHVSQINVYFPQMQYEEYQTQLLQTIDTYVSNLGGVIGLWTGISILSVIQCIAIIVFGPCED